MPYNDAGIGYRNVDTSFEAAVAGRRTAPVLRTMILKFLHVSGRSWTTEEIADALALEYRSVQPRLSELCNEGKVIDTGERRISRFNRRTIVWSAPHDGVA